MTNEGFAKFYDQNIGKVYRYIFLKVNSKETAQDLTSEAFLKLLEYAQKQDKIIENPRAFIYQVARNLLTDFYREKAKAALPLESLGEAVVAAADEGRGPEFEISLASDMERVQKALGQIKGEHADVIAWHYLDGLSIAEIGQIFGRPEGTVRVMLHRGLKELRKLLSA